MAKTYPKKSKALATYEKNVENKVIANRKEEKTVILDHFFDTMQEKQRHEDVKNVLDMENINFEMDLQITQTFGKNWQRHIQRRAKHWQQTRKMLKIK